MTEATLAALEDIEPLVPEPDSYFGSAAEPYQATVPVNESDDFYKIVEGRFHVKPAEEDGLIGDDPAVEELYAREDERRLYLVRDAENTTQLIVGLEQEGTEEEVAARAEIIVNDPNAEVLGKVLGTLMEKYYLSKVVAREEDVASLPSARHLNAAAYLIQAGFEEGETPGTFELNAAA